MVRLRAAAVVLEKQVLRHRGLLVSWAAPVEALHLVSGAGQSFSTWNHSSTIEHIQEHQLAPSRVAATSSATLAARLVHARLRQTVRAPSVTLAVRGDDAPIRAVTSPPTAWAQN